MKNCDNTKTHIFKVGLARSTKDEPQEIYGINRLTSVV